MFVSFGVREGADRISSADELSGEKTFGDEKQMF